MQVTRDFRLRSRLCFPYRSAAAVGGGGAVGTRAYACDGAEVETRDGSGHLDVEARVGLVSEKKERGRLCARARARACARECACTCADMNMNLDIERT